MLFDIRQAEPSSSIQVAHTLASLLWMLFRPHQSFSVIMVYVLLLISWSEKLKRTAQSWIGTDASYHNQERVRNPSL